jgi:hypothetical protein
MNTTKHPNIDNLSNWDIMNTAISLKINVRPYHKEFRFIRHKRRIHRISTVGVRNNNLLLYTKCKNKTQLWTQSEDRKTFTLGKYSQIDMSQIYKTIEYKLLLAEIIPSELSDIVLNFVF